MDEYLRNHKREDKQMNDVKCQCGAINGGYACSWSGPVKDTVVVEWMPVCHRISHEKAGNSGVYPHNGAERYWVSPDCAKGVLESEGVWAEVVERG